MVRYMCNDSSSNGCVFCENRSRESRTLPRDVNIFT
jgi:hypothetical protein